MLAADPHRPLPSLLDGTAAKRRFTGPEPWMAVLREPRR
jgi:hypothetical protein